MGQVVSAVRVIISVATTVSTAYEATKTILKKKTTTCEKIGAIASLIFAASDLAGTGIQNDSQTSGGAKLASSIVTGALDVTRTAVNYVAQKEEVKAEDVVYIAAVATNRASTVISRVVETNTDNTFLSQNRERLLAATNFTGTVSSALSKGIQIKQALQSKPKEKDKKEKARKVASSNVSNQRPTQTQTVPNQSHSTTTTIAASNRSSSRPVVNSQLEQKKNPQTLEERRKEWMDNFKKYWAEHNADFLKNWNKYSQSLREETKHVKKSLDDLTKEIEQKETEKDKCKDDFKEEENKLINDYKVKRNALYKEMNNLVDELVQAHDTYKLEILVFQEKFSAEFDKEMNRLELLKLEDEKSCRKIQELEYQLEESTKEFKEKKEKKCRSITDRHEELKKQVTALDKEKEIKLKNLKEIHDGQFKVLLNQLSDMFGRFEVLSADLDSLKKRREDLTKEKQKFEKRFLDAKKDFDKEIAKLDKSIEENRKDKIRVLRNRLDECKKYYDGNLDYLKCTQKRLELSSVHRNENNSKQIEELATKIDKTEKEFAVEKKKIEEKIVLLEKVKAPEPIGKEKTNAEQPTNEDDKKLRDFALNWKSLNEIPNDCVAPGFLPICKLSGKQIRHALVPAPGVKIPDGDTTFVFDRAALEASIKENDKFVPEGWSKTHIPLKMEYFIPNESKQKEIDNLLDGYSREILTTLE